MYNRSVTLGCPAPGEQQWYCPTDFVRRDQMAAFMNRLGNVTFQRGGNSFAAIGVLGTTDGQPLDIRVNDERVMRYEPNAVSPKVIGGNPANLASTNVLGATIGGGGSANSANRVTDNYGTIGGGTGNRAGNDTGPTSDATNMTVGGGFSNVASGASSTVAGGVVNVAEAFASSVGAGATNTASGAYSTVPGGRDVHGASR